MRLVATLLVAALLQCASASMMGIDFGSDFIKVAAPKHNNIDIVLNEQAHRKTANYIGFRSDERYFGEDAKNLAPRFPDNMFTYVNLLAGVPFNNSEHRDWYRNTLHIKATVEEARKPVAVEDANSTEEVPTLGTMALRTGSNPDIAYTAETLLAMQFGYLRSMVKKDTGSKLRDATLAIPASFSLRQRQALIDAAALAGVNVVATVHVTTAVALQYGLKNRGFGNQTVLLAVLDVGASHADIGIYEFTAPRVPRKGEKKLKKAEALGTLTAKAISSDDRVGGRMFDACLAEMIEDRFVAANPKLSRVLPADSLPKRKAIIALLRAGNKAKEILSVNKQANVVAEGMAPGKDFPTTITREEFEAQCAPLFKRLEALVSKALAAAGVSMEQLDAFEVAGGASRIPNVIDSLSALRGKPLDRTLNTDEAAAIGAAYFGGVAQQRFRVESFLIQEPALGAQPAGTDSVAFALSPKNEGDALTYRSLFTETSRIGQVKTITVNRTANFNITIAQNRSGEFVEDFKVRVTGIDSGLRSVSFYRLVDGLDISTELNHPNNSHTVRVEFRASESGLIVVESAELRIKYVKNVTRYVKVNLTEEEMAEEVARVTNITTAKHEIAEARRANATANASESEAQNATAATNSSDSEADANATETAQSPEEAAQARLNARIAKAVAGISTTKKVAEVNEEMKQTTLTLKTRNVYTFPSPITRGDKKQLRQILDDFDFADEQRRLLAKAKNDLEGYLIWMKSDGVLENPKLKESGRLTEEAVAAVEAAVKAAQDWLDDEAGDSTPREEYEAQLATLKAVAKPLLAKPKAATKADPEPSAEAEAEAEAEAPAADASESQGSDEAASDPDTAAGSEASDDGASDEDTASDASKEPTEL